MQTQMLPVTDRYGRPVPQMTAAEQTTFQDVLQDVLSARRGVLTLDLRKDAHHQFVLDRFGGDEYLERYFPSSRQLVDSTKAVHQAQGGPATKTLLEMEDPPGDAWHPMVNITYLGMERDGKTVAAQGVVTLPYLATSIFVNLALIDNTTKRQLGNVTLPMQFNCSTVKIEAIGILFPLEPVNVTAVITAQIMAEGAGVVQHVVATTQIGAAVVQSVNVANPNRKQHPTREYIKVALNRTPSQQPDCDYYYTYGEQGPVPIVGLQVNGSAQLVAGFAVAPMPNFSGSCLLMRRSSTGDGATLAFPEAQIPGLCTGAGNTVTWNIGPNWFQKAPWDQGQTIDLDFLLNFNIFPGGSTFVRVTSVPQAVSAMPNVASIPPLLFVWGCVAAGTNVRLADGSTRPIDTLTVGERVADGRGGSLRIAELWRGHEQRPMYRLTTESGASVLLTDGHPVPTKDGVRLARELAAGMVVTSAAGEERLSAVEQVPHDGLVFNLDLLPDGAATLGDIDDDAITPFEAGGILVGDNRMQGVWAARRCNAKLAGDPLAALDHGWRLDVLNSRRLAAGLEPVERVPD